MVGPNNAVFWLHPELQRGFGFWHLPMSILQSRRFLKMNMPMCSRRVCEACLGFFIVSKGFIRSGTFFSTRV